MDKLDFLAAFPEARKDAFKAEAIQNSFVGAGLILSDPDRVRSPLKQSIKDPCTIRTVDPPI